MPPGQRGGGSLLWSGSGFKFLVCGSGRLLGISGPRFSSVSYSPVSSLGSRGLIHKESLEAGTAPLKHSLPWTAALGASVDLPGLGMEVESESEEHKWQLGKQLESEMPTYRDPQEQGHPPQLLLCPLPQLRSLPLWPWGLPCASKHRGVDGARSPECKGADSVAIVTWWSGLVVSVW